VLTDRLRHNLFNRPVRGSRLVAAILLVSGSLLVASCGDDPPTTPTEIPFSDLFSSIIGPLGSASRTFTIDESITVKITLAAFTAGSDVSMGLGLGVPAASGSGCDLRTDVTVKADGTSPHITSSIGAGTHCVKLYDLGELGRRTSSFAITINEE